VVGKWGVAVEHFLWSRVHTFVQRASAYHGIFPLEFPVSWLSFSSPFGWMTRCCDFFSCFFFVVARYLSVHSTLLMLLSLCRSMWAPLCSGMFGRMQDVRWQRLANPELGSLSRRLDQDWRSISATQEVLDRQPTRGGRIGAGRVSFFSPPFSLNPVNRPNCFHAEYSIHSTWLAQTE
jgi:hypothetical protein